MLRQEKALKKAVKAESAVFLLVASGPSLSVQQIQMAQQYRDRLTTIAVNNNYRIVPWADVLYACDGKWWGWHAAEPEMAVFGGRKITRDEHAAEKYGLEYIKSSPSLGLSLDPQVINEGCNGGYQAINLALHLGAKKILLIGYDMQLGSSGQTHWFGDHPDGMPPPVDMFAQMYPSLADHAQRIGLEIINCSIETALTCFRRESLASALSSALGRP